MKLRDLDLNLLVVLYEVLNKGSFSKAAHSLGMSQPAVSNALSRLRKILGDDLVLKTSKGIAPTPFARNMAEPVGRALEAILDAVGTVSVFDPATSERNFKVALTDVGEIYFLPSIMSLLSREGRRITISTVRITDVTLKDEMEQGQIDLAIGPQPNFEFGFYQRRLFTQQYVCLFRKDHPCAKDGMTLTGFEAAEHVSIGDEGPGHAAIEAAFQRAGVKRDVKLCVPNFVAVVHILDSTDMIAVVPELFARSARENMGLVSARPPIDLPEVAINITWHAQYHRDAANKWLRQLVVDQFSS
jgi:DNA-binding transcriptional LysR family regulator